MIISFVCAYTRIEHTKVLAQKKAPIFVGAFEIVWKALNVVTQ